MRVFLICLLTMLNAVAAPPETRQDMTVVGDQQVTSIRNEQPGHGPIIGHVQNYADVKFERSVVLSFHRQGIIADVVVREGDAVTQGDLLAKLDATVAAAEASVARERAALVENVQAAEKEAEAAGIEYRIVRDGNAKSAGTYPKVEVERRRLANEAAVVELALQQRQLQIARLESELAEARLETYRLCAPFSGIVSRIHASTGEATDAGRIVLELVDPDTLIAEAHVSVPEANRLERGSPVDLVLQSDNRKRTAVRGQVTFVDLTIQTLRDVVRVTARIPNPDRTLRAGVRAHLEPVTTASSTAHAAETPPARNGN